mmetsp:Transcript_5618/g.13881  ORF Transcript_5618/g.13881 Transcript_5618/m.13881 type:complete len:217 (+) Transcript_5618:539-1189(+)
MPGDTSSFFCAMFKSTVSCLGRGFCSGSGSSASVIVEEQDFSELHFASFVGKLRRSAGPSVSSKSKSQPLFGSTYGSTSGAPDAFAGRDLAGTGRKGGERERLSNASQSKPDSKNQAWQATFSSPPGRMASRSLGSGRQSSQTRRAHAASGSGKETLSNPFKISAKICASSSPWKGTSDVMNSKINTPNVHQSTAFVCPEALTISGAKYSGVPQVV